MDRALLGLAAISAAIVITSSASAQSAGVGASGFGASAGIRLDVQSPSRDRMGGHRLGRHRDDRDHRRHGHDGLVGGGYYGAGYEDYGDYDGNRSFDPDKWNDWWHERPERAYPRWMSRNQDCQRPWYSGDVLTC
jgi:hypothetical protein